MKALRLLAIILLLCSSAGAFPNVSQQGTFITITNDSSTGTTLNTLTSLSSASPSKAIITSAGSTSGIVGITVAGAGIANAALIQQLGQTNCIFDGSTQAGDSVVASSTTNGYCHDTGSSTTASGSIGTVTTTNNAGGTYTVILSATSSGGSSGLQPINLLPSQSGNYNGQGFDISNTTIGQVTPLAGTFTDLSNAGATFISDTTGSGNGQITGVNTVAYVDPAAYGASWYVNGKPSNSTASLTITSGLPTLSGSTGDFAPNEYVFAAHAGAACSAQGIGNCPAPTGVALHTGTVEELAIGTTPTNIVVGHPLAVGEVQTPSPSPNGSAVTFTGTTTNGTIDTGSFFLFITPHNGTGAIKVYAQSNTTALVGYPGVSGTINYSTGGWSVTVPAALAPASDAVFTAKYSYSGSGNAAAIKRVGYHYDQEQFQLTSALPTGQPGVYTTTSNGDGTYTLAFNAQDTGQLVDIYYEQTTPPSGANSICVEVAGVDGPTYGLSAATSPVCLNSISYTLPTMTAPIYVDWTGDNYYAHVIYESFNSGSYVWMGETYASDLGPAGTNGNVPANTSNSNVSDFSPTTWEEWGSNTWQDSFGSVPATPPASSQNENYNARILSVSGGAITTDTNAGASGTFTLQHNDGPAIRAALFSSDCAVGGPATGGCRIQLPASLTAAINADYISMPPANITLAGSGVDGTTLVMYGDGGGPPSVEANFAATTTYPQGSTIIPQTNNLQYNVFESNFSSSCTSASAPGSWPTALGSTVTSGTCTFTNIGSDGQIGISALRFTGSGFLAQSNFSGAGAFATIERGNGIFTVDFLHETSFIAKIQHASRADGLWTHLFAGFINTGTGWARRPVVAYGAVNEVTWQLWDVFTSWPGKFLDCSFCYGQANTNETFQMPTDFENPWNMVRPMAAGVQYIQGMEMQNLYAADIAAVTLSSGSGGTTPNPRGVEAVSDGIDWHIHSIWWFWAGGNWPLNGIWARSNVAGSTLLVDQITTNGDKFGIWSGGVTPVTVHSGRIVVNDGGVGVNITSGDARFPVVAPAVGSTLEEGIALGYSINNSTCQSLTVQTGSNSLTQSTAIPVINCPTAASQITDINGDRYKRSPQFTQAESGGGTLTPDLSQGAFQPITIADNSAFTIAAPANKVTSATASQIWTLELINNSGGTTGTITVSAYKTDGTWTGTINSGKRRICDAVEDNTNHYLRNCQDY